MAEEILYDGYVKVNRVSGKEVVTVTDSVAFLVFNKTKKEIIFVSQVRAPMISAENPEGRILEVPAGRFDIKIGVKGLICKELQEELGITGVSDESIILVSEQPFALSPGVLSERQYLAYVEIEGSQMDPEDKEYGLKDEGEIIRRVFVPLEKLSSLPITDMKTFALVQWILREKSK